MTLREDEFTVGDSTGEMTSLLTADLLHHLSITAAQTATKVDGIDDGSKVLPS